MTTLICGSLAFDNIMVFMSVTIKGRRYRVGRE